MTALEALPYPTRKLPVTKIEVASVLFIKQHKILKSIANAEEIIYVGLSNAFLRFQLCFDMILAGGATLKCRHNIEHESN